MILSIVHWMVMNNECTGDSRCVPDVQYVCPRKKMEPYAVVTPLRKAASYEPCIAILGIWGDTWLIRGKYGIYVAVRGSYGALTGSTWCLLPRKISPIYCRVSYVAVTRIPSLVLHNTWHYVIIRYRYRELPKFFFILFILKQFSHVLCNFDDIINIVHDLELNIP